MKLLLTVMSEDFPKCAQLRDDSAGVDNLSSPSRRISSTEPRANFPVGNFEQISGV